LTSVGYLSERKKEIGRRTTISTNTPYNNVFVHVVYFLCRRRLGAAATLHLLDDVDVQV